MSITIQTNDVFIWSYCTTISDIGGSLSEKQDVCGQCVYVGIKTLPMDIWTIEKGEVMRIKALSLDESYGYMVSHVSLDGQMVVQIKELSLDDSYG